MRNSVLFTRESYVDLNNFSFKPIIRFDIEKINNLISNNTDYFYFKLIDDDYRFESLSFKEYGDSSYWDILLVLNLREENMYSLPKNYNYLLSKSGVINNKMVTYFQNLNSDSNLKNLLDVEEKENDKKRNVRFIRKEYIPTFTEALKGCIYEY